MAKAAFNFPLTGSLGDCSIYKMRGTDKLILRSKGGPSKHKVLTEPTLEKMRLNMAEFSGCGKAASKILRAMTGLKHLADFNFSGNLAAISKTIQKLDEVHNIGERSILFSEQKQILSGFNLNKQHPFDSVVKNSPSFSFSRNDLKVNLVFPTIFPKINIESPWNLGYYRFIVVMGIIPDMASTKYGYAQASEEVTYNTVDDISGWYQLDLAAPRRNIELRLEDPVFLDETGSMVVSIGIEFGKMLNDTVQPVKYTGCAKILGLG